MPRQPAAREWCPDRLVQAFHTQAMRPRRTLSQALSPRLQPVGAPWATAHGATYGKRADAAECRVIDFYFTMDTNHSDFAHGFFY